MSLSAGTARTLVRQFARNAGDSTSYDDASIDNAIKIIGLRFVRKTRCTRTVTALTLTIASNALPALPSGFRPEYAISAWLTGNSLSQNVDIIGFNDLQGKRQEDDRSAAPEFMAFSSFVTGEVYPKPDFAYVISVVWYEPFNSSTFNVPDELLYEILETGAVWKLQGNEPENQKIALAKKADYLELEAASMGMGNLGAKSYDAVPDDDGTIEAAGD